VAQIPAQPITVNKRVGTAIGDNLRAYRRRNRLDQERVAARMRSLGIPWRQVTVSESELGRRNVTVTELVALTLVLGVNITELLNPLLPDQRGDTLGSLMLGDAPTGFPILSPYLDAFVCGHRRRLQPATWADDNSIGSIAFIEVAPEAEQS
jgi:transcriptional regulator with XRE-family HTH domain